ncbi:hypothetical protein ACFLTM_02555 [Candidatus Bipolaricaulota bacterium]
MTDTDHWQKEDWHMWLEYLWKELQYFENRIGMLDTKASIVLAVQVGALALVATILGIERFRMAVAPLTTLSVLLLLGLAVVLLLLHTIRPTVRLWHLRINDLSKIIGDGKSTLRSRYECTSTEFEAAIKDLKSDAAKREKELIDQIHAIRQTHVLRNNRFRYAMLLAKAQIAVAGIGFVVVTVFAYLIEEPIKTGTAIGIILGLVGAAIGLALCIVGFCKHRECKKELKELKEAAADPTAGDA